jgi:hypothetical protein
MSHATKRARKSSSSTPSRIPNSNQNNVEDDAVVELTPQPSRPPPPVDPETRRAELEIERLKLELRRTEIEAQTRRFEAEMQTRRHQIDEETKRQTFVATMRHRDVEAEMRTREFEAAQMTRCAELEHLRMAQQRPAADEVEADAAESVGVESASASKSAVVAVDGNVEAQAIDSAAETQQQRPASRDLVQVVVKTLHSKQNYMIVVDLNETVLKCKEVLKCVSGICVDQQRLFFAGIVLEADDRTLASYGVYEMSTLIVMLRLRGC